MYKSLRDAKQCASDAGSLTLVGSALMEACKTQATFVKAYESLPAYDRLDRDLMIDAETFESTGLLDAIAERLGEQGVREYDEWVYVDPGVLAGVGITREDDVPRLSVMVTGVVSAWAVAWPAPHLRPSLTLGQPPAFGPA